jgi:putative transposase
MMRLTFPPKKLCRRKKKRLTGIGVAMGAMSSIRPNVIWAMDFQFDTTAEGRTLRCST